MCWDFSESITSETNGSTNGENTALFNISRFNINWNKLKPN